MSFLTLLSKSHTSKQWVTDDEMLALMNAARDRTKRGDRALTIAALHADIFKYMDACKEDTYVRGPNWARLLRRGHGERYYLWAVAKPVDGVPHAGRVLRVAPLSASLHVFPDAGNAACYTQQQQAEQARGGAKRTGGAGAKRRNV